MLIRFRVRNFLSFRDEVELSMIAGASRHHPQHVFPAGKSGIDLLRCGVVYGANASGKSNLIKAADFARNFIRQGLKPKERIPLRPFKLDPDFSAQPAKFEFEFQQGEKCYVYGFELTPAKVQAEYLYEIKKSPQKMLFERRTNGDEKTEVEIGLKLPAKQKQFLQEFSSGTRPNQLFLTKCYEDNNVNYFNEIMSWFLNLEIIFPGTKYQDWPFQVVARDNNVIPQIIKFLDALDTGVCDFSTEPVKLEGTIPSEIIEDFRHDEKANIAVITDPKGMIFTLTREEGGLRLGKIVLKHRVQGCDSDVIFDLDEESDGTLRLLDLVPLLFLKDKVFLVDELDRSLHPSLSYKLIELFLENPVNSQLIVTTHESHLLDLDLLRRDEIWFMEKDRKGATSLYSLEDFTPRHDKDVRKGYLLGRFGALPWVRNVHLDLEEVE
jgi:uncharacterized protein